MSFTVPVLDNSSKHADVSLPEDLQNVNDIQKEDWKVEGKIGSGSFADVYLIKYKETNVVLKELKHQDLRGRSLNLFYKEIQILDSIPEHENITKLIGMCRCPFALIMDYVYFTFSPFNLKQASGGQLSDIVHNLSQFLAVLDRKGNVDAFSNFFLQIAEDITKALEHLHQLDCVHRDLKPQNILVSNQHYCSLEKFQTVCKNVPIICKLTDFGEARSEFIQTNTLLQSRVDDGQMRGTVIYHAPETYMSNDKFNLEQLKMIDMWAVGLVFFNILNPDLDYPYQRDMEKKGRQNLTAIFLNEVFEKKRRPLFSDKYPLLRTQLTSIDQACCDCTNFDWESRPSASRLRKFLRTSSGYRRTGTEDKKEEKTTLESGTNKAAEDPSGTNKAAEDPSGTNKAAEDPSGTKKAAEDPSGTKKAATGTGDALPAHWDEIVDDKNLSKLASVMTGDWKLFARECLKLPEAIIQQCIGNTPTDSVYERVFQVLLKWKRKNQTDATYSELNKALKQFEAAPEMYDALKVKE